MSELEMLKRENAELKRVNKVKHEMLLDEVKLCGIYRKALENACAKLEDFECLYGNCKQASEYRRELLEQARKDIEDER